MQKMDWTKLLNYSSFTVKNSGSTADFNLSRTPFQMDYDRIIFSEDFRRLDKKTQVHPLKINDHVHARMTHSLETSCVGRSLGSLVGQKLADMKDFHPYKELLPLKRNSDAVLPIFTGQIVQAACLAHDIGNPPFGHAGEELIQDWFRARKDTVIFKDLENEEMNDLMNFEGNAQAFRVLTRTSMKKDRGGMGITYAVLCSMMKYPWIYSDKLPSDKVKFCCFSSEKEYLKQAAEACGLLPSGVSEEGFSYTRHPFAYLCEASDDICYNIMDLEDAYELKILDYGTVYKIFAELCRDYKEFDFSRYENGNDKAMLAHMRAIAIHECIKAAVDVFTDRYSDIISGSIEPRFSLIDNTKNHIGEVISEAKNISKTQVFTSERKTQLEIAANKALDTLLTNLCGAVYELHMKEEKKITGFNRKILSLMGGGVPKKEDTLFAKYQKVVDYIAGMTDNYAIRIAKNLNGIVE